MKSSFKDNCSFLSEDETSEYFDLYNKDHKEVVNYINPFDMLGVAATPFMGIC